VAILFKTKTKTEALIPDFPEQMGLKKQSGCPKLTVDNQVLVALQYWREYRT
jgi:hypothetical protein